jgi:DNA-binding MarR family transcriptional regulator
MDPVFYALKRAFHSTLRISRRDFKAIGNTAARMDILHALYNRGRPWKRPMWQSILRRIIGYTARSTISELLKELEALLWVRRKQSLEDKRQVEVELTDTGRKKLREAYWRFSGAWPLEAPIRAKGWREPVATERQAWSGYLHKLGRLARSLFNIRVALRDTGCVHYRWLDD